MAFYRSPMVLFLLSVFNLSSMLLRFVIILILGLLVLADSLMTRMPRHFGDAGPLARDGTYAHTDDFAAAARYAPTLC